MKITTKGQVTIPLEIREKHGFLPHTEVEFRVVGNTVQLVKSERGSSRGEALIAWMRGRSKGKMSTAEIMALTRGAEYESRALRKTGKLR